MAFDARMFYVVLSVHSSYMHCLTSSRFADFLALATSEIGAFLSLGAFYHASFPDVSFCSL